MNSCDQQSHELAPNVTAALALEVAEEATGFYFVFVGRHIQLTESVQKQ
jgi:hypothetical protein